MPKGRGSNLKDRELYEELREDGASKEKAARISNAAASQGRKKVGSRGANAKDYDERTVPELRKRAKELGLRGYSGKNKSELVERGDGCRDSRACARTRIPASAACGRGPASATWMRRDAHHRVVISSASGRW